MLLPRRTILGACLLVVLSGAVLALALDRTARALPPAGTDLLNATAQVSITSRLGSETINLTGTVTVDREAPHMDNGVEVIDAEIIALNLTGQSLTGAVSVTERDENASLGDIRSKQAGQEFPASSFFDVFVDVSVPASPSPAIFLHNEVPLSVIASPNLTAWPPVGATYAATFNPCIPLLNPAEEIPTDPANVCVNSLSITVGVAKTPGAPTPTGTLVPQPTATATSAPVTTSTSTATAASTNTPTRTATRTPTVPAKECGDVNDDGRVNSVDASLILQLSAELISTLENPDSADVDGDGDINSVDALFILQVDAGLLEVEGLDCG